MLDDKERELRNSKRRALALLLAAAGVFAATLFAPRGFWIDGVKAVAEASMVGALADWFAVVALFRRVPIPFVSRHTEIIPQNKDKIADNLAAFVHEKFLDPASIVALIKRPRSGRPGSRSGSRRRATRTCWAATRRASSRSGST